MPIRSFALPGEASLILFLQTFSNEFTVLLAKLISFFGDSITTVLVICFFYLCFDKRIGEEIASCIIFASAANGMIKMLFFRARPYLVEDGVRCLAPVDKAADLTDLAAQGYSFPSGHTTNASVLYGSLARIFRKKAVTVSAVVLCVLIAASRVFLGCHYPTDILAGLALGAGIAFLLPWIRRRLSNDTLFYALLILVTLPGWFYCKTSDFYTGFGMLVGFFAGLLFEKRFVRFQTTRNPLRMVLRMAGVGGIYALLDFLLKLPFSREFLDAGTFAAHFIRAGRYAVILFLLCGVYPLLFRLTQKIGRKDV